MRMGTRRQETGGGAVPIPIYLLTGFLGSGKTTLLRRIINAPGLSDTALIINEFGEVGLDQKLVQSSIENVLLMEDGCLCCSVRGDLIDVIGDLFARVRNAEIPPFSRIVIETTGLADPTMIVQDLVTARGLRGRVELAKVIVTVDGVLGSSQLAEADEVTAQIAQADLCVITKCDVADLGQVHQLVDDIRAINPLAEIVTSDDERADPSAILDFSGTRLRGAGRTDGFRCDGGEACTHGPGVPCTEHSLRRPTVAGSVHRNVQSWSVRHDAPISWPRFRQWLDLLYSSRPADMLRLKGILRVQGRDKPVLVHGVGATLSITEIDQWPGDDRVSELVVIVTNLPAEQVGQLFRVMVLPGPHVPSANADATGPNLALPQDRKDSPHALVAQP
jgi:G3E family GTPase